MKSASKHYFATVDIRYGGEDGLEFFRAFVEKYDLTWKGK